MPVDLAFHFLLLSTWWYTMFLAGALSLLNTISGFRCVKSTWLVFFFRSRAFCCAHSNQAPMMSGCNGCLCEWTALWLSISVFCFTGFVVVYLSMVFFCFCSSWGERRRLFLTPSQQWRLYYLYGWWLGKGGGGWRILYSHKKGKQYLS